MPGFAIVRDERELELPAGRSQQRFVDVAAWIDPATVNFVSLTDPATRVLEQGFQFDLANPRKLLARHVGRQVTVERTPGVDGGRLSGTLLSAGDGLVLRAADGTVTILRDYSAIRLADLPGIRSPDHAAPRSSGVGDILGLLHRRRREDEGPPILVALVGASGWRWSGMQIAEVSTSAQLSHALGQSDVDGDSPQQLLFGFAVLRGWRLLQGSDSSTRSCLFIFCPVGTRNADRASF